MTDVRGKDRGSLQRNWEEKKKPIASVVEAPLRKRRRSTENVRHEKKEDYARAKGGGD